MYRYPDADKLIFFGDPIDDDNESSHCDDDDDILSEEEDSTEYADMMAMISAQRQAYANLLDVPYAKPLIQGMLNWSVRNRLTTAEVCWSDRMIWDPDVKGELSHLAWAQ